MSDGESQWCYHARLIGSQYLCHSGLSPSGATMLGYYRDPMHIDKLFHFNEDIRNWYNCAHMKSFFYFLDNEEMFSR